MSLPSIAYLTTAYPSVSHTFIRREIMALEELGYSVTRIAIRESEDVVDPVDLAEREKTLYLIKQSKPGMVLSILHSLWRGGLRVLRGARAALVLNKSSERGLLRHLAYFVEALLLMDHARKFSVKHVHVHFGTNVSAVAMLSKLMGGPSFSMTIHGPDEFDAAIGFSLGRKMQEARFAIAISSYGSAQLRRWIPHTEWEKIKVVHCGVGRDWFEAAETIRPDSDQIVCVGRLAEQKGQLLLVDAFRQATERGFNGRLLLVGDGGLRPAVESFLSQHNLSSRVSITGWSTDAEVRRYLLSSRILVLPSFAEGLPVVIMEAMALGRPVLTTYVAGIPELVVPSIHGWLVAAGDTEALADAIVETGRIDTETLNAMGEACRERVAVRHTVQSEAAKLDKLFRECIG